MPQNINRVVLVGNLTRDPELRSTPSGASVCKLRLAVNTRRKDADGNWGDKPNFFDVTVWGARGENCATYLAKGRPVAVDGRLEWREWEAEGGKRQAVDVVAENVQFLRGADDGARGPAPDRGDVAPDDEGLAPAPVAPSADDDIPFARPSIPDREQRRRDLFVGDRWLA